MQIAAGYLSSGTARIWGVAEVPAAGGRHDWSEGGQAEARLVDGSGRTVATEYLTIAAGTRSVRFALGSRASLAPGEYQVHLRARGTAAPLDAMESVRASLAAAPIATGAVVVRRGVTTGNQPMPTADLRFRRTERISIEIPTTSTNAGTALLALAPLAPGDYVVEQSAGAETSRTAFRVLP